MTIRRGVLRLLAVCFLLSSGVTLGCRGCQDGGGGKDAGPQSAGSTERRDHDPTHDTGDAFRPVIPYDPDPDRPGHMRKRVTKKVRVRRYADGGKDVAYEDPPPPKRLPLTGVAVSNGTADGGVHASASVHTVSALSDGGVPPDAPWGPDYFYGNMVLFCVDDCPDAKFFQFVHVVVSSSRNAGPSFEWPWSYDTPDGTKGEYKPLPETVPGATTEPSMYDAPGFWAKPDWPTNNLKHDETVTVAESFETYVCCEHALIGFWSWSETLTYTVLKDGSLGEPVVTPATPTWDGNPSDGTQASRLVHDKLCK